LAFGASVPRGALGAAAGAARALQGVFVERAWGFLSRLARGSVEPGLHGRLVAGVEGPVALYVHMPFCREPLCRFCSFVRYPFRESIYRAYMAALRAETEWLLSAAEAARVEEVYVGGGTPTVDVYALAEYLDFVRGLVGRGVRFSVEANPRDLLRDGAVEALRGRVQRLSIGVQALSDERLRRLGRLNHTAAEAVEAVGRVVGVFPVVNVDMVWGAAGDTAETVAAEARAALGLGADQVTFYPLMPPPGLWGLYRSRRMGPWHPEEEEMYLAVLREAAEAGYGASTPWCMSRPGAGMVDEYVVEHEWFLAVGASAVGRLPGYVYANSFNPSRYVRLVSARGFSARYAARPRVDEEAAYTAAALLFGLRWRSGLLSARYGAPGAALDAYIEASLRLLGEGPGPRGLWRLGRAETLYALHAAQRSLYMAMNRFRRLGMAREAAAL